MKYQLPNIPGHIAGRKATLSINNGETIVKGRINSVTMRTSTNDATVMELAFDGGCVKAKIINGITHELEVED